MNINKIKKAIQLFLHGPVFDRCEEAIRQHNYEYLRSFSIIGVCVSFLTIVYGQIMQHVVTFNTEFIILFFYCLAVFGATFIIKKFMRYITPLLYILLTPLMLIGILMGTFFDPTQPSITIMVFLCVIPLFVLDRPWRVLLYITCVATMYTICCYIAKSNAVYVADMIDLVLFYFLGMGINCVILKDRMSNVEYAASILEMSQFDALTKIYNRGAGEQKIKEFLADEQYGMFCIMDIDDFKIINDKFGHMSGDQVLQQIAKQLSMSFDKNDIVMRMGGDEFAVYAIGITDITTATLHIQSLFSSIDNLCLSDMPNFTTALSLGASFFAQDDRKDFETLYHESDEALYNIKRKEKGTYSFFQK